MDLLASGDRLAFLYIVYNSTLLDRDEPVSFLRTLIKFYKLFSLAVLYFPD